MQNIRNSDHSRIYFPFSNRLNSSMMTILCELSLRPKDQRFWRKHSFTILNSNLISFLALKVRHFNQLEKKKRQRIQCLTGSSTAFNKIPNFLGEFQLRTVENQLSQKKMIYVVLNEIQFLLFLLISLTPTQWTLPLHKLPMFHYFNQCHNHTILKSQTRFSQTY